MRRFTFMVIIASITPLTGCIKPYPREEAKEVQNNETAFVVPLEGANKTKQAQFASVEFLEAAKVATKRITIPKRWQKTGRMRGDGQWIPTIRIITVDRTPVTRQWTPEAGTGTSQGNQSIQVESADSVGFPVGFGCTAMVKEEDTATFLYYYPSGSLARVMDSVAGLLAKQ